jgi:hypothetical protein
MDPEQTSEVRQLLSDIDRLITEMRMVRERVASMEQVVP